MLLGRQGTGKTNLLASNARRLGGGRAPEGPTDRGELYLFGDNVVLVDTSGEITDEPDALGALVKGAPRNVVSTGGSRPCMRWWFASRSGT